MIIDFLFCVLFATAARNLRMVGTLARGSTYLTGGGLKLGIRNTILWENGED